MSLTIDDLPSTDPCDPRGIKIHEIADFIERPATLPRRGKGPLHPADQVVELQDSGRRVPGRKWTTEKLTWPTATSDTVRDRAHRAGDQGASGVSSSSAARSESASQKKCLVQLGFGYSTVTTPTFGTQPHIRSELRGSTGPRAARQIISEVLHDAELTLLDDAALVVSGLVTNALQAGPHCTLAVGTAHLTASASRSPTHLPNYPSLANQTIDPVDSV